MNDDTYSIPKLPYIVAKVFNIDRLKYCVAVGHVLDVKATYVNAECREFDTEEERDVAYLFLAEKEVKMPNGCKISYVDEELTHSDLKKFNELFGVLKLYELLDDAMLKVLQSEKKDISEAIKNGLDEVELEDPDAYKRLYDLQTKLIEGHPFLKQLRDERLAEIKRRFIKQQHTTFIKPSVLDKERNRDD